MTVVNTYTEEELGLYDDMILNCPLARSAPVHSLSICVTKKGRRFLCMETTQDRKSTRLNSSHLVISYAVFCLKKERWRPLCWRGRAGHLHHLLRRDGGSRPGASSARRRCGRDRRKVLFLPGDSWLPARRTGR